ncbi:putative F-box domain, galactose oxidase/kelch, beta-propeller, F-box associated interaction [Helianthus annuus]|nr:putative F-box domain, galactose oxidase/kelch, beta-propeller, F-box associated interaction [Helianthus annuus]
MSDHIPFKIQSEIMKRLPVKSLLRFRSICKSWKSLIDSSDFIAYHSSQQQHLLVSYYDNDYEQKYVSIVDDHTFPQQKVFLTVPVSVKKMLEHHPRIISSCHGLVCLYCDSTRTAVIWNISLRKSVVVVVPASNAYKTAIGFGVCRETNDPKIVKIRYIGWWRSVDINATYIPSQVEVFTLSTGAWRSPFGSNLPRTSVHYYHDDEVVIDGVFYWLATNSNTMLIVSFNMTSEEFREITLPDDLSQTHSMSYLGNSLVVCGYDKLAIYRGLCVWTMRGSVSNSFTKLFTIAPNEYPILRGFRKSGEPIIAIQGEHLAVYKPDSKHIDFGIDGVEFLFKVYPYEETLFLLGQPDNMVYNGS